MTQREGDEKHGSQPGEAVQDRLIGLAPVQRNHNKSVRMSPRSWLSSDVKRAASAPFTAR